MSDLIFKQQIKKLESINNILQKLRFLYDWIDEVYADRLTIEQLFYYYLSRDRDVNEYKTLLMLSNGWKSDVFISRLRSELEIKMNGRLL